MYSVEEKANVIKMFGKKSVKEISKLTSISVSTLYKWKNEYESYKLVKSYIRNKEYDKAIEIALKFFTDEKFQVELMYCYVKKGEYDKAIGIAERFPESELIQNQLIAIYIKKGEYDKAIEIAEGFPESELIQKKLIAEKKRMNEFNMKKDAPASKQNTSPRGKIDCYELNVIRAKLVANTISTRDIELLDKVRNQIGDEIYNVVLAAICDRLNLKDRAIKILTTLNDSGNKKIRDMILQLRSKTKFYDIGKWDIIIGWPINKEVDLDAIEKQNLVILPDESNGLKVEEKSLPTGGKPKKTKPKKKIIYSTNFISSSDVKESSSKKKKPENEGMKVGGNEEEILKEMTIYDSLDKRYKEMCHTVKLKYYREMHNGNGRCEAIMKYDRLEEILCQDSSNEKAFLKLLLILIGEGFGDIIKNDYIKEFNLLNTRIQIKAHVRRLVRNIVKDKTEE